MPFIGAGRSSLAFGFVALGTLLGACPGCDDDVGAFPVDGTDTDPSSPSSDASTPPSEAGPPADAPWEMVFEDRESALFSVWGTTGDDVWVVGSDAGDGPLVLHYDGESWEAKDTGASGDLWWVSGHGNDVWMSGSDGLVLRYSVEDEQFEEFEMEKPITVYGIFPVATDDVWAVGGGFGAEVSTAIYRYDGQQWSEVDVPGDAEQPYFKVWGRSSEDLWVVGFGTEALHRVGEDWEVVPVPTEQRLFTVHGNDDYVAAVGGNIAGLLLEEDDGEWRNVTPENMPQMNGIWVPADGDAIAAGSGGFIYERKDGEWRDIEDVPLTAWDYHAVFIDDDGGQWAVGGLVAAPPFTAGMLAHRGVEVSDEGVPD